MADDRMAVLDTVRKAIADGDVDFLRVGVRVLAQAVMEAEVGELTGLPKGERDPAGCPQHASHADSAFHEHVACCSCASEALRTPDKPAHG